MKKCYTLACKLFVFSLIAFTATQLSAQTANLYSFSTSTPGALITQTSPTTIVAASVDDNVSTLRNIGFTFNYEGTNYTQFTASPDGWIKLGSPVGTNEYTNVITSTANVPRLLSSTLGS